MKVHGTQVAALLAAYLAVALRSSYGVAAAARDSDACDFGDAQMKRLCRKVESQEQYFEKMVDIYYKTDRMYHWYSSNKDWLQHARLGRMMKRLLKRAASVGGGGDVDETGDGRSEDADAAAATAQLDAKVQALTQQMAAMQKTLDGAQSQLKRLQSGSREEPASKSDVQSLSLQVSTSLVDLRIHVDKKEEEAKRQLQRVVDQTEKLDGRLNRTDQRVKGLADAPKCKCSTVDVGSNSTTAISNAPRTSSSGPSSDDTAAMFHDDLERAKAEMRAAMDQLRQQLDATAESVSQTMATARLTNDGALQNFSASYQENMKAMMVVFEDRMSENSRSAYDVIVNATLAFGEDLQLIRSSLSNSTADVQFLLGQDKKTVRGFEDLRSANRRHEANIQSVTTQLGEFRNQVQDQLTSIRNNFMQSVQEFYNKIVDRQNQMSYRLTSLVDDISAVKSKMRNLAVPSGAGQAVENGRNSDDGDADDGSPE